MTDHQIRRTLQMLLKQMQGHRAEHIILPLLDQVLAGLHHLRVPSFCMTLDRPATLRKNRMVWTAGTWIVTGEPIIISASDTRVHLIADCHADPEDIAVAACSADVIPTDRWQLPRDSDGWPIYPTNAEYRAALESAFQPPIPRYNTNQGEP